MKNVVLFKKSALWKKIVLCGALAWGATSATFAEDGYIQSDGTQLLNLGYIAKPTSKFVVDFQFQSTASGQFLFGAWRGGLGYGLFINSSSYFEYRINDWSHSRIKADKLRHTVEVDISEAKCRLLTDGEQIDTYTFATKQTESATYPLMAFAGSDNVQGTAFQAKSTARIYSIKAYESGTLVRSYVPCVKGGKAGLLEELSGQFLAPDIAVASGGDIKTIDDDPYVSSPNGGVVVDTGYYCGEKTRVECDYEILDDSESDVFMFSGGFDDVFEVRGYIGTDGNDNKVVNYGFCSNCSSYASTKVAVGKGIRRTLTLDGVAGNASLVSGVTTNYHAAISASYGGKCERYSLRLFCFMRETSGYCIKMKLYGFRIYEEGVLVRDYRPTLIDGVAVLKDAVYGSWIKSKTATELSSGGSITENNDAYLESDGRQGINLGYKVKTTSRVEVDFRYLSAGAATNPRLLIGGGAAASAADNPIRFGMAQNSDGNFEFCFPMKVGSYWSGGLFAADTKRHVGVLDVPNRKGSYTRFGSAEYSVTSTTNLTADSTYPLGLFGTTHSVNGNSFYVNYASTVRIYDVKIYESDVLVKHWIPYIHNGEVGLKELVGGTFQDCNNGRYVLPTVGGDIGYDSCPPYVESDGTQCINLGVKPKMNARIETEFAICETNNRSKGLIGSLYGKDIEKSLFWFNGGGGFEPCLGGDWFGSWSNSGMFFTKRTCKLDYKNRVAYLNDVIKTSKDSQTITRDATVPIGLFGLVSNTAGTSFSNTGIKARVFSVKVYDDDTLTNEFVPWVKDGVVGFRDTQTDAFVTKYQSGVSALKIGGIGTSCALAASSGQVPVDGEVTLTAGASGAVSYKWYRNGVEIDGETGSTLTVAWRNQRTADVYSVKPVYQFYVHTEILGDAVGTTVEYMRPGLFILLK